MRATLHFPASASCALGAEISPCPILGREGPQQEGGGQWVEGWKHLRTLRLRAELIFKNVQIPVCSWPRHPSAFTSQNKRLVSAATKETSQENSYIVLKCFETLSMVSRETQAFLGNSKERHRGAGLNSKNASTQPFVKAEV